GGGPHAARAGARQRVRRPGRAAPARAQGRARPARGGRLPHEPRVLMPVVALISGRGSNMQALLDAGIPLAAVISNRADAQGLAVAAARGVPTRVVEHRAFPSRETFDAALARE